MKRREFLKAATVTAACPTIGLATGAIVVCQGNRELKDITPAEIEELIAWLKVDLKHVVTVESARDVELDWSNSLHPVYQATYHECSSVMDPHITMQIWQQSYYGEWDTSEIFIEMGEVWASGLPIKGGRETVKWFLDHGFKVW